MSISSGTTPNVPSDLEMMPHLLNFLEHNGSACPTTTRPLIAHTGVTTS